MKHKKSESIWDATGSHTYYTVHKNKPIFKASSHTEPLLVTPEMAGGKLLPHLKSLFSWHLQSLVSFSKIPTAILTTGILCCLL